MNNKSGSENKPSPSLCRECGCDSVEFSHLQKLCEEQRGEIAELKFLLMQTEAELTLRNGQLDKARFQSDIYAKQVVLKEELINERSSQLAHLNLVLEGYKLMAGLSTTDHLKVQGMIESQLATQTERVRVLEEALKHSKPLVQFLIARNPQHEEPHKALELIEQALKQESLGDGGKND